jgi:hypothetical protein
VFGCVARGLAALVFAIGIATSSTCAQQASIAIATGGTGGVYYPLGVGMADILAKAIPGVASVARVTGGSIDNLKLLGSHNSAIGFTMADAAFDAVRGLGKFKSGKIEARTLMVLYPNRMHIVTLAGKGIETLADLKGKRISIGSPGSASEVMALRVIAAAGLDKDKDFRRERLDLIDAAKALSEGRIDAFFWAGGLPSPAVKDLAETPGLRIRLIDHANTLGRMNAVYGGIYSQGVIPAATYLGQDKANAIAIVQNLLVGDVSLPDDIAYRIVKALVDNRDQLVAIHGDAAGIAIDNQSIKNSPIPWHPGATKYFKEKGVAM